MPSLVIQKILETRKITDYLDKKHIYPDGPQSNGKLRYHCPLHEGDNTPSFYVYLESGEYQNFWCFGCKAHLNIIHLYRDLEKVSLGQAIRALAEGLDIDINAELNSVVAEIENDHSVSMEFSPVDMSLLIGRQLYDFSLMVDKDSECLKSVDHLNKITDQAVARGDMKGLQTILDSLPDVLLKRARSYTEEKENRLLTGQ